MWCLLQDLMDKIDTALKEQKGKGRRMVIEEIDDASSSDADSEEYDTPPENNGHDDPISQSKQVSKQEETINESNEVNSNADSQTVAASDVLKPNTTIEQEVTQNVKLDLSTKNKTSTTSKNIKTVPAEIIQSEIERLQLPDAVSFLKTKGNEAFKNGQYGEAIKVYDSAMEKLNKGNFLLMFVNYHL